MATADRSKCSGESMTVADSRHEPHPCGPAFCLSYRTRRPAALHCPPEESAFFPVGGRSPRHPTGKGLARQTPHSLQAFRLLPPVARLYSRMSEGNGSWFGKFARKASHHAGRPGTFATAIVLILLWGASGPLFGFSDTWQLIINTSTTIVTFLMVFLIQNSQNRDSEALQIKLDELLRAKKSANNAFMDLEDLTEEELDLIREKFVKLAEQERARDQQAKPS